MSIGVVVLVTAAALALLAAVIYRANRRSRVTTASATLAPSPGKAPASVTGALDPKTVGRLRAGREGDRLSEDEIAREKMGARGRPGEPLPAYDLPENQTQIPKPLDPGHTA
jgi:hypothetical protein